MSHGKFPWRRQRSRNKNDTPKMREKDNENDEMRFGGEVRITRRIELNFWRTCLLNAAGLFLAWLSTDSIEFGNVFAFGLLVVLIWFLNWIIRPLLVLFTLPFIIFTMGVGMLFINGAIIYFAARLIPFDGLEVKSYWAALWASFLVSVLSWGVAMMRSERTIRRALKKNSGDGDVIDV